MRQTLAQGLPPEQLEAIRAEGRRDLAEEQQVLDGLLSRVMDLLPTAGVNAAIALGSAQILTGPKLLKVIAFETKSKQGLNEWDGWGVETIRQVNVQKMVLRTPPDGVKNLTTLQPYSFF
jgi:hypothetical protein